jgi:hypothetical protein
MSYGCDTIDHSVLINRGKRRNFVLVIMVVLLAGIGD